MAACHQPGLRLGVSCGRAGGGRKSGRECTDVQLSRASVLDSAEDSFLQNVGE